MNAPAPAAAVAAVTKLAQIPLAKIRPSRTHIQELRRARFSKPALQELADSIRKVGVLQPIVVRPWQPAPTLNRVDSDPTHEIVAGERRWAAARLAGLTAMDANVTALSDEQVIEAQLIENLQREDLHPLEEAAGYEELMKVAKLNKEDLGDKVGKSRSWVYSRLNLLKLPKEAQDALQDGRLDVSRALIVASVAQPNQRDEVLRMATERNHDNNFRYSVRQLRAEIVKDRLTFPLVGAPFPIEDARLLPDMGACGGCQYRTGNCDPDAPDPDVCTNVSCYHLKVKAHGARRRAEILAGGGKVLTGDAARKVSPSVKTVYGHVDLDLVCEHDTYPEPEPTDVDYDNVSDPKMAAWRAKEEAWQPRTYRALLAGQKVESVLIDDPKTKQLRELVPFKAAQALLKKVKIDLPSYYNKQRPSFGGNRGSASTGKTDDPAKKAAEEAKRELEDRIEKIVVGRILEQVKAKHDGKLGDTELIYLAGPVLSDLDDAAAGPLLKLYGLKDSRNGNDWDHMLEKLPAKDLQRFILLGIVGVGLTDEYGATEAIAKSVCARLKIDRKKIEAEVRAGLTKAAAPKAGQVWPFPTDSKSPAKKPAKKSSKKK